MQNLLDLLNEGFLGFVAFLPTLLGAIVVFVAGWVISAVLQRITKSALTYSRRSEQTAQVTSGIVFWAAMVTTIVLTAGILGIVSINALLVPLVSYIPNIFVAVIELVVAYEIGQLAHDVLMGRAGDGATKATIAATSKWAIVGFGVFAALSQLGVSPVIVNSMFILLLGTVAAAAAIAFGVGNIGLAGEIGRNWYSKASETRRKMQGENEDDITRRRAA